jgi:EAL domain-containing protein (putative c-di-GMP-specific phosphodiesterase class I)
MASGDVVLLLRTDRSERLEDLARQVCETFPSDPAAHVGPEGLVELMDLEADLPRLRQMARAWEAAARTQARREALGAGPGGLRPMTPAVLGQVCEAIGRGDVSSLVRRQPVALWLDGAPPQPIFWEIYASIADLGKAVAPDTDLASDRWLFQHLTSALDRRVLAMLPRANDQSLMAKVSLNLNLSTVLSSVFLDFDRQLRMAARGTICVELQALDVLADMRGFAVARALLHGRGYKICIDNLDPLNAPMASRRALGFDLAKVAFGEELEPGAEGVHAERLAAWIAETGPERVILSRVETPEMVAAGRRIGMNLFQGRYVDMELGAARLRAGAR